MDQENVGQAEKGGLAGDTVLIAIDGSKQAEEAFDWYFKNLHRTDNRIILVHGLEIPMMPTRDSYDQQVRAGNKKKEELEEKYKQKFKVYGMTIGRLVTGYEKPGELIVDTARKENATYVVMGTRGVSKLRRTVLGTVSDFVVHHIHCPIIVSRT